MLRIRPTSSRDTASLPAIERSSGELFRQSPGLEWIADDDVQSETQHQAFVADGVALVAELEGNVIGFLTGSVELDALHIWQIAVHKTHQRRGIGRKLIEATQQLAVTHAAIALTLTTFRGVTWNEPYYRRLGFKTLAPPELTSRLAAILRAEGEAGLPVARRCAMRKYVDEPINGSSRL